MLLASAKSFFLVLIVVFTRLILNFTRLTPKITRLDNKVTRLAPKFTRLSEFDSAAAPKHPKNQKARSLPVSGPSVTY